VVGVLAVAASVGASSAAGLGRASAVISVSAPCGARGAWAPRISHVILIVEENHAYNQIIGHAPYITSLAHRCGLASNYHALSYPSLPNYIGMTSGTIPPGVAHKDCLPTGSCRSSASNIFHRVVSWRVYAESMPKPCDRANTSLYAPRHTAAPYYTNIVYCAQHDFPLGTTGSGAFQAALRNGALPRFSLVVPNLVNDMHGGCIPCGDNWLRTWIPKIVAAPNYRSGSTAIFITWDSDNGSSKNHVATIIISPYTHPGTINQTPFNHYSLLKAMLAVLHLPLIGATPYIEGGLATAFHL
jgi:phosphatidylinositol-3-phosphatase